MANILQNGLSTLLRFLPRSLRYRYVANIARQFSLVGTERLRNLYVLAQRIEEESIPGDVIECGVCNGGTAAILAYWGTRSLLSRTVWLFDSFQGMPTTTRSDGEAAKTHVGKEVGNVDTVVHVLERVGADMAHVRIVKGWFQDTFLSVSIPQIALLNIDADWYDSVKLCLDTFYDAVVTRGFISIDDYGHWPGCKKAVDEFLATRRLSLELRTVDYTARWFRKP